MPPSVAISIRGIAFKNHFTAFEHSALRDEHGRVAAGVLVPVVHEKLGEALDIEFVFGDDTTVGGAGHGREHCGVTSVATKDFDDHEALMRASRGAEAVNKLQSARDAGTEADAVVRAGDVVVHGLGNGDDLETFFVKADAVAKRVITANGDERVNAEPCQIFEDFGGEVIFLEVEGIFQMGGHARLADAARIRARGVEESTTGARGAVDDFLGENQEIVGIVVIFFADHID